jgi:hypothetical protein
VVLADIFELRIGTATATLKWYENTGKRFAWEVSNCKTCLETAQ